MFSESKTPMICTASLSVCFNNVPFFTVLKKKQACSSLFRSKARHLSVISRIPKALGLKAIIFEESCDRG
jgi:hypothetical protein